MLKKVFSIVAVFLLLVGCRPISTVQEKSSSSFSILSSSGTPSLALLAISNGDYDIRIADTIGPIEKAFLNRSYDIIISPVDTGVRYCQAKGNYKMLSIVEYGTLSLCSIDEENINSTVGAYGEKSIVGYLTKFLEKDTFYGLTIKWYETLEEMGKDLIEGNIKSAILDEINFNYFNNYLNFEIFKIADLKNDYEVKTGFNSYPMYGIFVAEDIVKNNINELVDFSKIIRNSIITYKKDKTTFNEVLSNAKLSVMGFDNPDLISESYNYCGIDFVYANQDLNSLKQILEICEIKLDENIIIK